MKKAELEYECNTIKHYHHTNGISEGTLAYELLVGLCDPFFFLHAPFKNRAVVI